MTPPRFFQPEAACEQDSPCAEATSFDFGRLGVLLDTRQHKALTQLAKSLKSSGEILETVATWTDVHARQCHTDGALDCARRTLRAIEALTH